MLLKDLVFEQKADESLVEFIQSNCKSYLDKLDIDADLYSEFPMYRGMDSRLTGGRAVTLKDDNGKDVQCYIKTVRKNREPTTTHYQISKLFDSELHKKFGWFPRSSGMFCFGYAGQHAAGDFGDGAVYQVIPMGQMDFVYSPKVSDATYTLKHIIKNAGVEVLDDDEEYSADGMRRIAPAIKQLVESYTNSSLMKAVEAEPAREIMIKCDRYLIIPA